MSTLSAILMPTDWQYVYGVDPTTDNEWLRYALLVWKKQTFLYVTLLLLLVPLTIGVAMPMILSSNGWLIVSGLFWAVLACGLMFIRLNGRVVRMEALHLVIRKERQRRANKVRAEREFMLRQMATYA